MINVTVKMLGSRGCIGTELNVDPPGRHQHTKFAGFSQKLLKLRKLLVPNRIRHCDKCESKDAGTLRGVSRNVTSGGGRSKCRSPREEPTLTHSEKKSETRMHSILGSFRKTK